MKCPKCQFENPDDAKFCIECANPMEFHCPNCGIITPATGKFCKECGYDLKRPKEGPSPINYSEPQSYTPKFLADKILTTRSSIEGERKLVTVLVADVANYTRMSQKLAIRLATELNDQKTALRCLSEIPWVIYNSTLKDKVPEYSKQALDLARSLKDTGAEAMIISQDAYWRYLWQDTDENQTCRDALAMAEKAGHIETIFRCRLALSLFERWAGNPQKSLQYLEGMLEMMQSVYNLYVASSISYVQAWALTDIGKYNEAIAFLNQWLELAEQNSLYLALGRIYNSFGWILSEIYSIDKALEFNHKSLENATNLRKSPALIISASEMQAMAEVNIIENKFEMGYVDEAWNHIIVYVFLAKLGITESSQRNGNQCSYYSFGS